jgi:hypothetical protein
MGCFGGVSNDFELNRVDMVMDACINKFGFGELDYKSFQARACKDGLDGCDLMRLTILPIWKNLIRNMQDHQNWNVKICTILLETVIWKLEDEPLRFLGP